MQRSTAQILVELNKEAISYDFSAAVTKIAALQATHSDLDASEDKIRKFVVDAQGLDDITRLIVLNGIHATDNTKALLPAMQKILTAPNQKNFSQQIDIILNGAALLKREYVTLDLFEKLQFLFLYLETPPLERADFLLSQSRHAKNLESITADLENKYAQIFNTHPAYATAVFNDWFISFSEGRKLSFLNWLRVQDPATISEIITAQQELFEENLTEMITTITNDPNPDFQNLLNSILTIQETQTKKFTVLNTATPAPAAAGVAANIARSPGSTNLHDDHPELAYPAKVFRP